MPDFLQTGDNKMSATSEILAERVRLLAKHIQEVTDRGEDASQLLLQYKELTKQLTQANEALTENRQILKGLYKEIHGNSKSQPICTDDGITKRSSSSCDESCSATT